jgi:lauroyl/myristoyl acyltransferase
MQWFSIRDVGLIAKLPLSAAIATIVPPDRWAQLTDFLIRTYGRASPAAVRDAAALLQRHLDPAQLVQPVDDVARSYLRNIRLDNLGTLRSHDPRGWPIRNRLEGFEHLRKAQVSAEGVLLWVAPFIFAGLVAKRALHEAGVALHQLSTSTHGTSSRSRFGVGYLRNIRVSVENRHLKERVTIPLDGSLHGPLRRLTTLLKEGEVVSVTIGSMGNQPAKVPFLRGQIRIATGVPSLALRSRAAILPVVTVRTAANTFTTFIEPPLATAGSGSTPSRRDGLVRELAARLEPFALQWPDQVCWHHGLFGPGKPSQQGPAEADPSD